MFVNPIRTALTNLKGRFARRKPAVPPPAPKKPIPPKVERKENIPFDMSKLLPPVDHPPFNKPNQLERSKANRSRKHRKQLAKHNKRQRSMNPQHGRKF